MISSCSPPSGRKPPLTIERKWSIVLPLELTRSVLSLAGVRVGRRIDQPAFLPDFLLKPHARSRWCASSWAAPSVRTAMLLPCIAMARATDQASLEPPMYSQSAKPEFVDSTQAEDGSHHPAAVPVRGRGLAVPWSANIPRAARPRLIPARRTGSLDGRSVWSCRMGFPSSSASAIATASTRLCERVRPPSTGACSRPSTASGCGWPIDSSACTATQPNVPSPDGDRSPRRELAEIETPIFPHYSLLEGHDRFSRLPAATARAFRPLHRESCEFPSPARALRAARCEPLVRRAARASIA